MYARYEENKFNGFQEHEVLEMLLYNYLKQKDTNELAHKLIKEFGSLENVLTAAKTLSIRQQDISPHCLGSSPFTVLKYTAAEHILFSCFASEEL